MMYCPECHTNCDPDDVMLCGPCSRKLNDQVKAQLVEREQMSVNFKFLFACIDQAHTILCPGHIGTWQDRAKKVVEVARLKAELASKEE